MEKTWALKSGVLYLCKSGWTTKKEQADLWAATMACEVVELALPPRHASNYEWFHQL